MDMNNDKQNGIGQIHVYTGNGKGKTTAAFGLALRAAMAGKAVYIGQFVKSQKYNETKITSKLDKFVVEQFGCGCMLSRHATDEDREEAAHGLEVCAQHIKEGKWEVVILDEITIALHLELIKIEDVITMLDNRAPHVEIILTGRYAPQALMDYADLVTDMREVKHYYSTKGLISRNGIDK